MLGGTLITVSVVNDTKKKAEFIHNSSENVKSWGPISFVASCQKFRMRVRKSERSSVTKYDMGVRITLAANIIYQKKKSIDNVGQHTAPYFYSLDMQSPLALSLPSHCWASFI